MAESPAHRFGQIVGELLEEILDERLTAFCRERPQYYLDRKGARPPVRAGKKLTWVDKYDNTHDLDFVIERGGTATQQGRPVAFVEAAWRRYTKHSKNKAQEIQGAVLPIRELHHRDAPFLGAVLAGNFTKPALEQLRRQDFNIVHLGYEAIMQGMRSVGIDARFDENTPDKVFASCVRDIQALRGRRPALRQGIVDACGDAFDQFFVTLARTLDRQVERITIVALHGEAVEVSSGLAARRYFDAFQPAIEALPFQRFDVTVRFSNGDEVRMQLTDADDARRFLDYITA